MPLVKSLISSTNIEQPLTYFCNKSFESGIFPDEVKIVKIVPLFKNGECKEFSNYRPMSQQTIVSYIKRIILCIQSVWVQRSPPYTELALMELIEDITSNLDNNLVTLTGVLLI